MAISKSAKTATLASLSFTALAGIAFQPALAQEAGAPQSSAPVEAVSAAAFARFAPSEDRIAHVIDYAAWDQAMRYIVFPMGKSLRQTPGTAEKGLGSRRQYGHDSRYRLEGNRVMFSFFDDELRRNIHDYRMELQSVPDSLDIARLPRNEQLAYWINLHNVAVMDQIAQNWPMRQPSTLEIDGLPLDEAKFITVQGVQMSPRDIRTQIVYPNWRDPRVIYGFWRGDIGGPSIQRGAFDAQNIDRLLDRGATEFVNSLRGVQKRSDRLQVSTIYEEAREFYFPNWEADIRQHISAHAEEEVKQILGRTQAVEAVIYEADIADLAGGIREPSYSNVTVNGSAQRFRIPQGMAALLREQETKLERIEREGRTGRVYFENIRLPGEDNSDDEIK